MIAFQAFGWALTARFGAKTIHTRLPSPRVSRIYGLQPMEKDRELSKILRGLPSDLELFLRVNIFLFLIFI